MTYVIVIDFGYKLMFYDGTKYYSKLKAEKAIEQKRKTIDYALTLAEIKLLKKRAPTKT